MAVNYVGPSTLLWIALGVVSAIALIGVAIWLAVRRRR
jgi:LPXTG-motif cell wall-anchored protein